MHKTRFIKSLLLLLEYTPTLYLSAFSWVASCTVHIYRAIYGPIKLLAKRNRVSFTEFKLNGKMKNLNFVAVINPIQRKTLWLDYKLKKQI